MFVTVEWNVRYSNMNNYITRQNHDSVITLSSIKLLVSLAILKEKKLFLFIKAEISSLNCKLETK